MDNNSMPVTMSVAYDFTDLKGMTFVTEGKQYKITEVSSKSSFSFRLHDTGFGEGIYGE